MAFDRFTDRARRVINFARQEANELHHEYVGTEHLLLGLVDEHHGIAGHVLREMGVTSLKLKAEIERLVKPGPQQPPRNELPLTPRAKKCLELAMEYAGENAHNYIGTEHMLVGLIRENEGIAAQALLNLGLNSQAVEERIAEFLGVETPAQRDAIARAAAISAAREAVVEAAMLETLAEERDGELRNHIPEPYIPRDLAWQLFSSLNECIGVMRVRRRAAVAELRKITEQA